MSGHGFGGEDKARSTSLLGALRLQLARREAPPGKAPEDLVDPFLTLSDRGSFSRTLHAHLVGPGGDTVLSFALKLQSDEYPVPPGGLSARGLTNVGVEERWKREVELARSAGPEGVGICAPLDVLQPNGTDGIGHMAPTAYCKRREAFFPLFCPACGGPLRDVRSEQVLEQRGLPGYGTSLARFLGCETCLAEPSVPLWALIHEGAGEGVVEDWAALVSAYAEVALGEAPASGAAAELPCTGCEHVQDCFRAPEEAADALRLLTPVTFYESRCLAYPTFDLRLDEFGALLGGASEDDLEARIGDSGRLAVLKPILAGVASGSDRYYFSQDTAGKFGLEVLKLKLTAFRSLCRAVGALHRHTQEPHLSVSPSRAMIRLHRERASVPKLWDFDLTLLGLGNTRARDLRGLGDIELKPVPYERPISIESEFAAPPLRQGELSDLPCHLVLTAVHPEQDGRFRIEGVVESERIDARTVEEKDLVTVAVVQARPPLSLKLAAHPSAISRGALNFRSAPMELTAGLRVQLDQLIGERLGRAKFTVLPCLHVPCDIHSLGRTLFALILSNASQRSADVGTEVDRIADALSEHARAHPQDSSASLLEKARELLRADTFHKRQLFYRPDEFPSAAEAIPDEAWFGTLVLGLRAVTMIRGFGVCRSYSDFDPTHPEVNVEYLLQLLDTLIRKVDDALFGLSGRAREIGDVIAKAQKARDGHTSASGDETMVAAPPRRTERRT